LIDESRIVFFQAEFLYYSFNCAGQLHAPGLRLSAHLRRNLGPGQSLAAQFSQLQFLFAQISDV
jgi:hypothetical protein